MSGTIDTQFDEDTYMMYLSGNTTFDFGSTLGYYINLYNKDGQLFSPSTSYDTFSLNLPADKYYINVSSISHLDGYYYQITSPLQYMVDITTTKPSDATIASIEKSLFSAPTIVNDIIPLSLQIGVPYKLLIDAAEKIDTTSLFEVVGDSSAISTILDGNILTITPLKTGVTNLKIKAFANSKETVKNQLIVVSNLKTYMGKEMLLRGTFSSDLKQKVSFDTLLGGNCTIEGFDDNYSDSFYITIGGVESNTAIAKTFNNQRYTITASLTSSSGKYFDFDPTNPSFYIKILCPNVDISNSTVAQTLGFSNKVLDSNSSITIAKGWNLISLPSTDKISATQFFLNNPFASIIWQYQNSSWLAASTDENISSSISGKFTPIKYIDNTQGFWVKAFEPFELTSYGQVKSNNLALLQRVSGWTIASTQIAIVPHDVFNANPKITIIWLYKNGSWYAKGATSDIDSNIIAAKISLIDNIDAGSAYWVNTK